MSNPVKEYHPNGNLKSEEWFNDQGEQHRVGESMVKSPAGIYYDENGDETHREYWVRGVQVESLGELIDFYLDDRVVQILD